MCREKRNLCRQSYIQLVLHLSLLITLENQKIITLQTLQFPTCHNLFLLCISFFKIAADRLGFAGLQNPNLCNGGDVIHCCLTSQGRKCLRGISSESLPIFFFSFLNSRSSPCVTYVLIPIYN